jgi:hypothetical protein
MHAGVPQGRGLNKFGMALTGSHTNVKISSPLLKFIQARGVTEFQAFDGRDDAAKKPCENATGAHFNGPGNTLGGEVAHGINPAHGVRHLLVETFASFGAGTDLASLPVVDQREREVPEFSGIQIGAEALLGWLHQD